MVFSGTTARSAAAIFSIVLLMWPAAAQAPAPLSAPPYPSPEVLNYSIEWRLITAGNAEVTMVRSGTGWQTTLLLRSAGLVSKLYKVDDRLTAHYENAFCIQNSTFNAIEGKRRRDTHVTYDYERRKASYLERDLVKDRVVTQTEVDIPACAHDVIGGLVFLRGQNVEPGHSIHLPMSDGKKSVMARVEAQEREDVKINGRVYKAIRYEAFILNKILYQRSGRLFIWITEDAARLPIKLQIRTGFPIGTVTLQLDKVTQP